MAYRQRRPDPSNNAFEPKSEQVRQTKHGGGGGSCCSCFGSSKTYEASTIDYSREENIPQEHKQATYESFVPSVNRDRESYVARDQQPQVKGTKYKEVDQSELNPPTGLEQGYLSPTDKWKNTDHEKVKDNGKYINRPEFSKEDKQWKEEDNNRSWGGKSSALTKDEGKGNNRSHGGTKSDTTKSAISSGKHADSPPRQTKEKVNSTFEQVGAQPRKEKEKGIDSTVPQINPPPRKEEKESNLPKHSNDDPAIAPYKNIKKEYNQETNKNTWSDHTKKETSSPVQTTVQERKDRDKQREKIS